jgi:preprotein translocase subunit YajC
VLISNAYAQAAEAAPNAAAGGMNIMFIVLMFVVMYFLMIRPQMKRAKEHKTLLDALAKGDEIVTNGGIAGRVVAVGDNFVQVDIAAAHADGVALAKAAAANTVVAVQKQAISTVLPKGTLKAL